MQQVGAGVGGCACGWGGSVRWGPDAAGGCGWVGVGVSTTQPWALHSGGSEHHATLGPTHWWG